MPDFITIRNARLHNLKGISVDIPIGKTTLVSGVSGSGKSTIVVDILAKVLRQRYIDLLGDSSYKAGPLVLEEEEHVDLIEPVCPVILFKGQVVQRNPRSTVGTITGFNRLIKNLFFIGGQYACPECKEPIKAMEPDEIAGAIIESCEGRRLIIKSPLLVPDKTSEQRDFLAGLQAAGYLRLQVRNKVYMIDEQLGAALAALSSGNGQVYLIVDRLKLRPGNHQRLFDSIRTALQEGGGRVVCEAEMQEGGFKSLHFSTNFWCFSCQKAFSDPLEPSGNKPLVSASLTLNGRELHEVMDGSLQEAYSHFLDTESAGFICEKDAAYTLLHKILSHMKSVCRLNIGHLRLSAPVTEISTGEFLKLRLAAIVAQRPVGVVFVLDEPVSLLPPDEREEVLNLITRLKDSGNTVIMIEHAPEAAEIADYFLEIGPGGGEKGGRVICQSWLDDKARAELVSELGGILDLQGIKSCVSIRGSLSIPLSSFFSPLESITIVEGGLNVICGPTGSGKTTMLSEIRDCLERRAYCKGQIFHVPQVLTYKSKYSMPATALSVFGKIRGLFARTKLAREYGLTSRLFSLTQKGGRCEMCKGTGRVEKEGLGYLATYLCPVCKGARYNLDILNVRYKGLNIDEVLNLSISRAADFFSGVSAIRSPLEIAERVGIGYLKLGQPVSALSSGEVQRLKIASHLVGGKRDTPGFFLLDQPTSGLHPRDVARLMDFFKELLTFGATLIVAENHPALVEAALQVIRLKCS